MPIAHHAAHGFDDNVNTDTNEQKAVGKRCKDLDTPKTKRISRIVLIAGLGRKAKSKERNQQRGKVNQHVSRIRKKRQTPGEEAPYHLRNEHDRRKRYRYSQGADIRVLVDVTVVVMAVVMMMTMFMMMARHYRTPRLFMICVA